MNTVPALWLRTALCSALVIVNSEAFAQAKPDPTPSQGAVSTPGSAPVKQSDSTPSREQCVQSHHQAQQAQNEGHLVRARELARTCTSLVCPGLVVSDCARWLNDLDQRIPSVVFEVRVDGQPDLSAIIVADGNRVEEWTRGEALRLDPGSHQFRFELAPHQPIIQNLLLAEGMRYRVVPAEFKSQAQPSPATTSPTTAGATTPPAVPPAVPAERPVPFAVYPLLGVGAVGAIGFGVFGMIGRSKQSDLESGCKPDCTDSALKSMKTNYLIGDISLGVGAASLIAAGVLYIARPEKPMTATVGFSPLPGGAATFASYQF